MDVCAIDQTQEETGIGKSDRGARRHDRRSAAAHDVRKRRLCLTERVRTVEIRPAYGQVALVTQFSTEFISMVVLDPGETSDRRGLLKN